MNAPFDLLRVLLAIWISKGWAENAARWGQMKQPFCKRQSLYARTRAVVLHDRVLNGRTE